MPYTEGSPTGATMEITLEDEHGEARTFSSPEGGTIEVPEGVWRLVEPWPPGLEGNIDVLRMGEPPEAVGPFRLRVAG